MSEYWVVVANAGRARIFSREKKFSPPVEIESLIHPESRLRRQDLAADRPGQVQESRTPAESPAGERTDPKALEATVFARELAQRLEQGRQQGRFSHLVVLAEPNFLGEIRRQLDHATAQLVAGTDTVDLTRAEIEQIAQTADSALA